MAEHSSPSSPPDAPSREEMLLDYIQAALTSADASEELPEELRDMKKAREVASLIWEIRRLAYALSNGELDYLCKGRGFVAGSLKAFQSNLRHLTWQAQRIARGEYHHRVNFLGDFSVAFNQMAEQLDSTINNLTCISEEYKDLSHRDPLTGLYNRYGFTKFAEQLMLKSACTQQASTLIMTDIDKFKNINDTYGHLCGDEVLREFSRKLLSILRSKDLCCRYGGEEFLILMPETPLDNGVSIAERLRTSIEDMIVTFEDRTLRLTASFGVSMVAWGAESEESFEERLNACVQLADANLYKAKASGRNRVVY